MGLVAEDLPSMDPTIQGHERPRTTGFGGLGFSFVLGLGGVGFLGVHDFCE